MITELSIYPATVRQTDADTLCRWKDKDEQEDEDDDEDEEEKERNS